MTSTLAPARTVPRTVTLDRAEGAALLAIARVCAARYGSPNARPFLAAAFAAAQELPLGVRRRLGGLRATAGVPYVVVEGVPVDDARLGPTPRHWSEADRAASAPYGCALVLLASLLGDCIAWEAQQGGRHVTDVLPTPGMEDSLVSSSSRAALGWHTEDAFSPYRADWVGLLALRNPDRTPTTIAAPDVEAIPGAVAAVLRGRRFLVLADDSHTDGPAPRPVALLSGHPDHPVLRVDRDFTVPADPGDRAAAAALAWLVGHLDERLDDVAVDAGSAVFLDNRSVVHGRKPFTARFDGSDRWLKRVNVVVDARRVVPGCDDVPARIVRSSEAPS